MNRKCTPDPTITTIRNLNATTTMTRRTRSLVGPQLGVVAVVIILLCQVSGILCFSVGVSESDTTFVVEATDIDQGEGCVNEVDGICQTCDR